MNSIKTKQQFTEPISDDLLERFTAKRNLTKSYDHVQNILEFYYISLKNLI